MFRYWIFLFASPPLFALTTLNVTQSSDNNPGGFGDPGELRYWLNTMNQDLNTGFLDDYAIVFASPMTIQLNGYKTTTYSWGIFIAQAKLSYVYKKPHNVGRINAAILNAPSSFVVEAFTAEQSLVSPGIELFWQTN